jgi:nitrite reductase/ring-hydroxylating ferredoxin subunit
VTTRIDVDSVLRDGAYYVLGDYALRRELYDTVLSAFHRGVEHYEGRACRAAVERDGLKNLHKHFPIQKIHYLENYLMKTLRDELYYWSYKVGAETLGLADPFYVVHIIVFRIHYPHLMARAARIEEPPAQWSERIRLGLASLRSWKMLRYYLGKARESGKANGVYNPFAYHGAMPIAARSHGPHIDTWYGHSYDGINLWLAVDGVNDDNTVILYPEMFGRPLPFDPTSMYITPGVELSPPRKIAIKPGDLLVFNPETLHATQVNISDETRVALTTRINPRQPRYSAKAPFHFEHWYSSRDLRRRKFWSIELFTAKEFLGEPSITQREAYSHAHRTVRLKKEDLLEAGAPLAICSGDTIKTGEKLAVDLANAKLLIFRDGAELRALSRTCPHLGVDLADGSHDETQVFCPGHGITYRWRDGTSKCDAYKLRIFKAFESEGMIYVARETAVTAATLGTSSKGADAIAV